MMNSLPSHHLFEPRGLYAPEKPEGSGKDILCANEVGIGFVATAYTDEILSPSTVLRHRAANRASPRSVGRVNYHKTNTVLLCLASNPVENLAVYPRCQSLTKSLSSIPFLPPLHVLEALNPKNGEGLPRKLVQGSVDVVLTFPESPLTTLALGFPPDDLVPDGLKVPSEVFSPGGRNQLVDSEVDAECFSRCPEKGIRHIHGDSQELFGEKRPLNQLGPGNREPFVKDFGFPNRETDSLTFVESGEPDNEIKGTFTFLDNHKLGVKNSGPTELRNPCQMTLGLGGPFGGDDHFKGLLEGLGLEAFRESGVLKTGQRFLVQFAREKPKGLDVEVDSGPVGFEEGSDLLTLLPCDVSHPQFGGSNHGLIIDPHTKESREKLLLNSDGHERE